MFLDNSEVPVGKEKLLLIPVISRKLLSLHSYVTAFSLKKFLSFIGIAVYLEQVYGVDMPPNRYWYCCLTMYDYSSSFRCSCYLLIAMTFERFYSIIRPHKAASFNTVKRARITITCIYVFCFTYGIPFLFIGGYNEVTCVINRYASDKGIGELYYWLTRMWLTDILTFIFPFISLLTMNSVIIHTLRKRSKLSLTDFTSQGQNEGLSFKSKHSEKQFVVILLLVTFVFLTLNIPVRAMVFYINFSIGNTPFYYAGLHLFDQIGEKAYYTNHGINFFLYVISGQKFRTDLRKLFHFKTYVTARHPV